LRARTRSVKEYKEYEIVMTIRTTDSVHRQAEVEAVARRYADAGVKNDLTVLIDSYHDDVVFHYCGRSRWLARIEGKRPASRCFRR
jgi:hypothetical protein